jgi:anti-sigma regulatory factor (Ser/Thr protein kinase)
MPSTTTMLPAHPVAPGIAREVVASFLGSGVTQRFAEDAALLTSELVSNSVIHGDMEPPETIALDLELDLHRLRVTVTDSDAPFASSPTRNIGGWGLVLVERISSRWGVHRNAPNHVWFELDR